MHIKVQLNVLKFLIHILNSPDSLVSNIYKNIKDSSAWNSNVKNLLNNLGFSHLNVNPNHIKSYINRIEQRLKDQNIQNMNSSLATCVKLAFFSKVHTPSKRAAYLDICKLKHDRSIISKSRLSAHKLAIEKGRYNNTERNKRLCISCNNGDVEEEYHFFSTCTHYSIQRKLFLEKLNKCSNKHYHYQFTMSEISYLLNSNSYNLLKLTIKFMSEC